MRGRLTRFGSWTALLLAPFGEAANASLSDSREVLSAAYLGSGSRAAPLFDFFAMPCDAIAAEVNGAWKFTVGNPAVDRCGHKTINRAQIPHAKQEGAIRLITLSILRHCQLRSRSRHTAL